VIVGGQGVAVNCCIFLFCGFLHGKHCSVAVGVPGRICSVSGMLCGLYWLLP